MWKNKSHFNKMSTKSKSKSNDAGILQDYFESNEQIKVTLIYKDVYKGDLMKQIVSTFNIVMIHINFYSFNILNISNTYFILFNVRRNYS